MTHLTLTRSIPLYSDYEDELMEVEVTDKKVELRWMDDRRWRYIVIPRESFREIIDTVAAFSALEFKEASNA